MKKNHIVIFSAPGVDVTDFIELLCSYGDYKNLDGDIIFENLKELNNLKGNYIVDIPFDFFLNIDKDTFNWINGNTTVLVVYHKNIVDHFFSYIFMSNNNEIKEISITSYDLDEFSEKNGYFKKQLSFLKEPIFLSLESYLDEYSEVLLNIPNFQKKNQEKKHNYSSVTKKTKSKWGMIKNKREVLKWMLQKNFYAINRDFLSFKKIDHTELIHEKDKYTNTVLVDWSLGNTCNYRCSYCPDSLHNGKIPWVDKSIVENYVEQIINHYALLGKKCCFQFTGGEPTLHPDFLSIIQYIKNKDAYVSLISNASMPISWWKKAVKNIDTINVTYHGEFATYESFIKIVEFLGSNIRVHVNVTMLLEEFEERKYIIKKLLSLNSLDISLTAKPLLVNFGSQLYDYSKEQLDFMKSVKKMNTQRYSGQVRGIMLKKNGEKSIPVKPAHLIAGKENSWIGWRCSIGIESLVIKNNGDVYRGQCRVGGKIGNIYISKTINFPNKTVECSKRWCSCASDILTTKKIK